MAITVKAHRRNGKIVKAHSRKTSKNRKHSLLVQYRNVMGLSAVERRAKNHVTADSYASEGRAIKKKILAKLTSKSSEGRVLGAQLRKANYWN